MPDTLLSAVVGARRPDPAGDLMISELLDAVGRRFSPECYLGFRNANASHDQAVLYCGLARSTNGLAGLVRRGLAAGAGHERLIEVSQFQGTSSYVCALEAGMTDSEYAWYANAAISTADLLAALSARCNGVSDCDLREFYSAGGQGVFYYTIALTNGASHDDVLTALAKGALITDYAICVAGETAACDARDLVDQVKSGTALDFELALFDYEDSRSSGYSHAEALAFLG
jgi:hypothetical protein